MEVNRKYENGSNLEYLSVLFYNCNDTRKWIKLVDEPTLAPNITTQSKWRKTYIIDGTNLECAYITVATHMMTMERMTLHLRKIT